MLNNNEALRTLAKQVSDLTSVVQLLQAERPPEESSIANVSAVESVPVFKKSRLPTPAFYSGEPELCRSFLAKCSLFISLQPSSFPTEVSKVAFIITLLSGKVALWETTV